MIERFPPWIGIQETPKEFYRSIGVGHAQKEINKTKTVRGLGVAWEFTVRTEWRRGGDRGSIIQTDTPTPFG
jgi:hypothetical protein